MDRAKKPNKQVKMKYVCSKKAISPMMNHLPTLAKFLCMKTCMCVKTEFLKTYVFECCKCFFFLIEIQKSKIWSFKLTLLKPKLIIYLNVKLLY